MAPNVHPIETTPLLASTSQCPSEDTIQEESEAPSKTATPENSLALGTSSRPFPGGSLNQLLLPICYFCGNIRRVLPGVSLTLENKGSVARDHLSLERTFLAYVRTSLALASAGVALVQLFTAASIKPQVRTSGRVQACIRPIGAATIIMALLILFIGVFRYFSVQTALTKGNFPVSRLVIGFIAFALTVLVILIFGILITGELEVRR